jgi:hypothetical protein
LICGDRPYLKPRPRSDKLDGWFVALRLISNRGGSSMVKRTLGSLTLLGLMASVSLQAHHSLAGVYDMKAEKEVSGTVDKVQFTNPHGSLSVNVKDAEGKETTWVLTLGSATALAQRGVGKTGPNALHTGDSVTVKFIPAKNGSPLGFLKSVKYPDGHEIVVSGGNPND